jgi:cell division protein FtsW
MDILQKSREETQAWFTRNLKGDPWIWGICIVMLLWSIVVVYSASVKDAYSQKDGNTEYYLYKHALLCFLSLLVMFFVHRIPYIKFVYVTRLAVWSSILLLIFTMFFGTSVNDASRWIEIPVIGQRFQPSEWAKVALISHLSLILARHIKGGWNTRELFMEPLALVGLVCGLIFTSNVSTALMLAGICFLLMFVGKVPLQYLLFTALGLVFFATMAILLNTTERSGTAKNILYGHGAWRIVWGRRFKKPSEAVFAGASERLYFRRNSRRIRNARRHFSYHIVSDPFVPGIKGN